MEAAFQRLLKQLNLHEHNPPIQGKLIEVMVDKQTETWFFNIELISPLPLETFQVFEERLRDLQKTLHHCKAFDVTYDYAQPSLDHLEAYYGYVLDRLIDYSPRFSAIRDFPIAIESQRIKVITPADGDFVSDWLIPLEQALARYGFHTTITMRRDEQTTIQARIDSADQSIVQSSPTKTQSFLAFQDHRVGKIKHTIKDIPSSEVDLNKTLSAYRQAEFSFEGEVFSVTTRKIKGNLTLFQFVVGDADDAIYVKKFCHDPNETLFLDTVEKGSLVRVVGRAEVDKYSRDIVITAQTIEVSKYLAERVKRDDDAEHKRVEFHLHSKMSTLDGIASIEDAVQTALHFGHSALALTDHNTVQAFPDFHKAVKNTSLKPIYGAEFNVVFDEDVQCFVDPLNRHQGLLSEQTYVVFDLETTGLSARYDDIIEISAVKIKGEQTLDRFDSFVRTNGKLSNFTKRLTGINDLDVQKAPPAEEVLAQFKTFLSDAILVAHNAPFDVGFLEAHLQRYDLLDRPYAYIDTLVMARMLYHDKLKRFGLKFVAKYFNVELTQHHRAEADTSATVNIFKAMMHDELHHRMQTLDDLKDPLKKNPSLNRYANAIKQHVTVWVKNQAGMEALYRCISLANTTYFQQTPMLPFSVLNQHRENLIIGSGCMHSAFFETAYQKSDDALLARAQQFDVLEVPVIDDTLHLFEDDFTDIDPIKTAVTVNTERQDLYRHRLQDTIQRILEVGRFFGLPVLATGDVHHIEPEDVKYRDIYIQTPIVGGGYHDLARKQIIPSQYFRTTQEMLAAFAFLKPDDQQAIVVEAPGTLAASIAACQPFPDTLFAPEDDFLSAHGVPSVEQALRRNVTEEAHRRYGQPLPTWIQARLDKELHAIITHRFSSVYYISHLLVKKSLDEGYLVGSRGSVGSSLVATLMDITEVNPLPPHYVCDKGHFSTYKRAPESLQSDPLRPEEQPFKAALDTVSCGFDLPVQQCPVCGSTLKRDGHDIPFETFLGFKGDKVPDIDLNFSGDYQAKVHDYIREIFGEDRAFRAGTISTVADKTAFGYVKGYLEKQNITLRSAEIERRAKVIAGVKRSTGQHPGGIVVVPASHRISEVTPIQYPADDVTSTWKTTHFDYHAFEANLFKLDVLGHDDPTMIRYLMDFAKKNPLDFPFTDARDIPLDDPKVYALLSGTEVIGVSPQELRSEVASYGVPEMGTSFVRGMLKAARPKTFADIVKISGLSHGTDVWLNNAELLVNGRKEDYGTVPFAQVIGCRDDIMVTLIQAGLKHEIAFEISEFIRRGLPTKNPTQWEGYQKIMIDHQLPPWYIWSCGQIKYMFPKAHATAYVMMALRIAWFKVHRPLYFYAAYFSKRARDFDLIAMRGGEVLIEQKLDEIQAKGTRATDTEKRLMTVLEVALEMTKRGYQFESIDIHASAAKDFVITKDHTLRLPFVALDGLGEKVAESIVTAREEKPFQSYEDLKARTLITKTAFDRLMALDALRDLPEDAQLSLFGAVS